MYGMMFQTMYDTTRQVLLQMRDRTSFEYKSPAIAFGLACES